MSQPNPVCALLCLPHTVHDPSPNSHPLVFEIVMGSDIVGHIGPGWHSSNPVIGSTQGCAFSKCQGHTLLWLCRAFAGLHLILEGTRLLEECEISCLQLLCQLIIGFTIDTGKLQ